MILIIALLLTTPLLAQPSKLSDIVASMSHQASVGVMVLDTLSGTTLYQNNPELYLMPASTQKLLTAVAAKKQLDHNAPFHTDIWLYGKVTDHIYHGDIVIKGTGDPGLTSEKLQQLIGRISHHQIHQVKGNIIILDNHFDSRTHIPGTLWEEQNDCYCSQASALSLDNNCYHINLLPKDQHIQVVNQRNNSLRSTIKRSSNCDDSNTPSIHHTLYGKGVIVDHQPFNTIHTLTGCWSKANHTPQRLALSTEHPAKYFQQQTHSILKALNISAPFPKLARHYQPKYPLLTHFKHNSAGLDDTLNTMLIKSSNFIANQLAKRMGALHYGEPATWEQSEQVLLQTLAPYKVDNETSFADGSGLSRNNRLQVQQLAYALQDIYHQPKLRSLLDGLNCVSVETKSNSSIPVCYKSGYIRGVIGRAGFISPRGKRPKTIVILANGNKSIDKLFEQHEQNIYQAIIADRY